MKFFKLPFLILALSLITACNFGKSGDKSDTANYASEKRDGFGFSEIKANGAVNLIITVESGFDVTVEGEEKLFKNLKTEVKGETLEIKTTGNFNSENKLRVKISLPELKNLEITGASEGVVKNVKADEFKLRVAGSSKLTIDGETNKLEITANGASTIDAENLKATDAKAKVAGASTITMSVSNELEAESLGASNIYYVGKPKKVEKDVTGAGEIREK